MKAMLTSLALICMLLCIVQCNSKSPEPEGEVSKSGITPVPLPTNIVPGFKFPEDSSTIIQSWLGGYNGTTYDSVSIYNHAWGIWAGLTAASGQSFDGQELLVYETWPGITDIRSIVESGVTTCEISKSSRGMLQPMRQKSHARNVLSGEMTSGVDSLNEEENDFWVSVSYDPTAACHTIQNQLLDSTVLKSMVKPGEIAAIPAFPNTAITLKPTYFFVRSKDTLVRMPAWPGPPDPAINFPDTLWNSYVYIDLNNGQEANKKIVTVGDGNNSQEAIANATCNLNDFIHFKLNKEAADYFNSQQSTEGDTAQAGDLAILVAMHVTTKEISNWTWQTFFWAADPDNPPFPSDAVAASLRPSQLNGAASHYALSAVYSMVRPNQPITGGTNAGMSPVIGYNPYLEPNLGQLNSTKNPNKLNAAMIWGVQSNCMSCHALAVYPGNPYTADQYIDLADKTYFGGKLQLDFAWSIQSTSNQTKAKTASQ